MFVYHASLSIVLSLECVYLYGFKHVCVYRCGQLAHSLLILLVCGCGEGALGGHFLTRVRTV